MKIYLLIILFVLFLLIGFGIYYFYLIQYKIFKDLVYICKSLKNNIAFNKNDIHSIINNVKNNISFSSKKILRNVDSVNASILAKEDKMNINNFFSSLGKGDVDYEINNIGYYESIFVNAERVSKENLSKKGNLYFKLIIMLGLVICIILI